MKNLVVSLAVFFLFSASANSQNLTPIVEANSSLDGPSLTEVSLPEENQASKLASNQFDVMQDLRDEVRSLRGLVEELSYDLQKMKQRQLDDYLDIDRRLSIQNIEVNSTEVLNSEGELITADNADDPSQPILTLGDPALDQTPVLADSVRDYEDYSKPMMPIKTVSMTESRDSEIKKLVDQGYSEEVAEALVESQR